MTQADFDSPALTDAQRAAMRSLQERSGTLTWQGKCEGCGEPDTPTRLVTKSARVDYIGVSNDGEALRWCCEECGGWSADPVSFD